MPLPDDLETHRDSVLAELDAVHDYYVSTKRAWRMVQGIALRRGKFSIFNAVTGNRTTEKDLPQKAQHYIANYVAAATFQQFVSLFEDFIFGVMQLWLLAYPQRLAKKLIPGTIIFSAPDLEYVKLAGRRQSGVE